MDKSKVKDVRVEGIAINDYPKFCDAYIYSATYEGRELTDKELQELTEDFDFLHEAINNQIH